MEQLAQATGFHCPQCNNKIIVNYFEMINTGKVVCHFCHLELLLNREQSAKALNVVDKAMEGVEQARAHVEQHKLEPENKRRRGRARQPRQSRSSRR